MAHWAQSGREPSFAVLNVMSPGPRTSKGVCSYICSTVDLIDQKVFFVKKAQKRKALEKLLREPEVEHTLVFSRTKHGANRIVRHLEQAGIAAAAIHGNKSQAARTRALDAFRNGSLKVLVATDIAARGIDLDGVTHVINFDLPNVPETYVHRIGRTARAGASGVAWSLCDAEARPMLFSIEKLIDKRLGTATLD